MLPNSNKQEMVAKSVCKIHGTAPKIQSFFSKNTNVLKRTLANFAKFLRTPFFIKHFGGCFWHELEEVVFL